MTKGRDNAAESLSDVLELVRLRRQNGLLSVERMQGGRFEEGEIYFQGGQPIYARIDQLSGHEALNRLLSWRQVYFTFLSNQPRPSANISPGFAVNESIAFAASVSASPSVPLAGPIPYTANSNIPITSPALPTFAQLGANEMPYEGYTRDNFFTQNSINSNAGTPGLEWLIPQKLGNERDVLSLPLTRPQRSIYMLVNGQRTVSDLSRCTRKSVQEIERLLSELQERGLISI